MQITLSQRSDTFNNGEHIKRRLTLTGYHYTLDNTYWIAFQ